MIRRTKISFIIVCFILFCCSNTFNAQNIQVNYFENLKINPDREKELLPFLKYDYKQNFFSYKLNYYDGLTFYKNDDFSVLNNKEKEFIEKEELIEEDGSGNKTINTGYEIDYKVINRTKELFYFKNFKKNLILCQLDNGVQVFQIKDQLFDWKWEITEEFKLVSGYKCRKAISRIMGYYFEAWYAEEIPVNAGPEKFDGLPGLILYVLAGNKEFVADYVKFLDEPIEIKMPEFPSETFTFQEVFSGATKPSKK